MRILIVSILFILSGCGVKQNVCNENMLFKEKFFKSINDIENTVCGKKGGGNEAYNQGLNFLNKYIKIDYSKTMNYRGIYTFKGLKDDKEAWLKWYEENKCRNIELK